MRCDMYTSHILPCSLATPSCFYYDSCIAFVAFIIETLQMGAACLHYYPPPVVPEFSISTHHPQPAVFVICIYSAFQLSVFLLFSDGTSDFLSLPSKICSLFHFELVVSCIWLTPCSGRSSFLLTGCERFLLWCSEQVIVAPYKGLARTLTCSHNNRFSLKMSSSLRAIWELDIYHPM